MICRRNEGGWHENQIKSSPPYTADHSPGTRWSAGLPADPTRFDRFLETSCLHIRAGGLDMYRGLLDTMGSNGQNSTIGMWAHPARSIAGLFLRGRRYQSAAVFAFERLEGRTLFAAVSWIAR